MPDVLLIGDTVRCMTLRHEIPVGIIDSFAYAEVDGTRYVGVHGLEHENVLHAAPDVELRAMESYKSEELVAQGLDVYEVWLEVCLRFAQDVGVRRAVVPQTFPVGQADRLRSAGIELVVDQRFFDDRRRVKTASQLDGIRAAQRAAEAGMSAIRDLLHRSQPTGEGRSVEGEPLTCERLREAAIEAFDRHGCRGDDLIVARGPQGAIGHHHGAGLILVDDVVVCDLFPMHVESHCFADMTRTFAVGAVDPEIAGWHAECLGALELATQLARPGVQGTDLHRAVDGFFAERGHPTNLTKEPGAVLRDGFFHSTGHGVGLEVHEPPYLGRGGHELVAGDVVAIEPGLYRHGLAGVRIEDLVLLTDDGPEVLTDFPYELVP